MGARELHLGPRPAVVGLDDLPGVPVGPELRQPGRVRGDARDDAARSRTGVSRSSASTPCRSSGSSSARTARTGPRRISCCSAFRALVRMAAPATIFKAEAIVPPWELTKYLGADDGGARPECQIAYNNQLMVLLWSALAERETSRHRPGAPAAGAAAGATRRGRPTSAATTTSAGPISDEDAAAVGLDGFAHRRFLNDFYSGRFPGLVRARRALPGEPGDRRCAHLGHGRLALRHRGGARERRRGRARARGPPPAARLRRRDVVRRGAARLHGRRARAAERLELRRRSEPRPTTTAGSTARRWTGPRPRAAATRERSKGACSRRPAAGSVPMRALAARCCTPRRRRRRSTTDGAGRVRLRPGRRQGRRFLGLANFTRGAGAPSMRA